MSNSHAVPGLIGMQSPRVAAMRFFLFALVALTAGCLDRPPAAPGVPPACGAGGGGASGPAAGWPNEPAGFTLLRDAPFTALNANGWRAVQRTTTNGSGVVVTNDSTAPASPPSVLQFPYGVGFPGGYTPAAVFYDPAAHTKDTYFGFWWKPSNPWQNNSPSDVNKIAFMFSASGGDIFLMMFGTRGAYTIRVAPEMPGDVRRLDPNITATPVALGAWHRIEWHVRYNSAAALRDGVTEWGLDGVLQARYVDLHLPDNPGIQEYQLAPTWGGVGDVKRETDCYWYDHARISAAP